jgi:hypothetical protein
MSTKQSKKNILRIKKAIQLYQISLLDIGGDSAQFDKTRFLTNESGFNIFSQSLSSLQNYNTFQKVTFYDVLI